MYIPGQILFAHGDFEGARERLMTVIETFPQTEEGEYSASVIINTYSADGDLENVVKWTQAFLAWRPPLGLGSADVDGSTVVWDDIKKQAEFKLCGKQIEAAAVLEGGQCYEDWYRRYPKDDNARFALYNAANNLEKGGKADQANDLFEEYLNTYPKDERSKDLYFRIATNYASILELDKAIGYYENLYNYFGPRKLGENHHVDAPNALYMAGFLRTGTGDFVGAAENFMEYVEKFPKANDREQVAWVAGEQWKKVSDEKALAYYKKYLRDFPSDNPDHVIDALYWMVQYETRSGNQRRIEKAWAELEDNYARLAADGTMGPMARNRAAEAAFRKLQAQFDEFAGEDYPKGEERLISFLLEDKVAEYEAISKNALGIIDTYADFEYSSAAIYIWGSAYLAYAEYLYNVPMPKEFVGNFELEDLWYQKWSEQAAPLEEKAIARFEANLKKAKDEKRSSVWIDRTIVALNDINPSAYPLEKAEIRGDSDASVIPSSGPLSQPETSDEQEAE
jgi:TolA-binding protein